MRNRVLSGMGAGVVLLWCATAGAVEYNNLGAAGGWDDVEKTSSVSYVLDRSDYTQDSGLSQSDITDALRSAFGTWADVASSSLSFTENPDDGGNYDLTDGPADSGGPPWFGGYSGDSLDGGANYLYANITFGGWLPNSYFDYLSDGVLGNEPRSDILAVAWTGRVKGPLSKKPRWIADIFFNDGWTWTTSGDLPGTEEFEIDIETVMLHELGHGIGLGHEDDVESVMNSLYAGIERGLYQDDIDGVTSLYPEKSGGGGGGKGKPPWAGGGGRNKMSIFTLADFQDYLDASQTPEPATITLIGIGVAGVFAARKTKRR
ncbi:MAG: matrixin family metalloprotease [Planctomycetia bacterium]|nr:matrixin family metalloprotease [Planctomycetia bacterium]